MLHYEKDWFDRLLELEDRYNNGQEDDLYDAICVLLDCIDEAYTRGYTVCKFETKVCNEEGVGH